MDKYDTNDSDSWNQTGIEFDEGVFQIPNAIISK
jgi:hypothetical protein